MKRIVIGLVLGMSVAFAGATPPPPPAFGINLNGPSDWNTELPFVDVFRFSRPWISQRLGADFGRGPRLDLDETGYPRRLEADCWADSPLCTIEAPHWPAGDYVVTWKGRGRITFVGGAARVVAEQPGRMVVNVQPERGTFFLRLLATDPADPVRGIRVIMPGFEKAVETNPWNPSFLARWRGVSCIRFMDFMATNGSRWRTWAERPKVDDATFSDRGVALELIADLGNRLDADVWVCVPHAADDDLVLRMARLLAKAVRPDRRIYVEYSNEVWNATFPQHRYAAERGLALGLADKPWEAAWRYSALRSQEVFRIMAGEIEPRRLVRVLAAQSGSIQVAKSMLEFRGTATCVDALAIAPYVDLTVAPAPERYFPLSVNEVTAWSPDDVLAYLEAKVLPGKRATIREHRELADRYALRLIAYEGGQHLVGVRGAENNDALTRLFQATNRAAGMEGLYAKMLAAWGEEGGELFCHFSSVAKWTKWGCWGVLEYADDPPAESPKWRGLQRWAAQIGRPFGPGVSGGDKIDEVNAGKKVDAQR